MLPFLPARVSSRSSANTEGVCAQEATNEHAINGGCREAEASASTQGGEVRSRVGGFLEPEQGSVSETRAAVAEGQEGLSTQR